ncbi:MAG TPA: antibiotic biosynthesis monooxygenase [Bacteroidales bacterium]|nr:antibiotic biosynthesis monooxygenase [Bacteroidales bacterium]
MIVTCVHINVKPENVREFIKAMIENHEDSVQEPGNLRFDVLQKADDPCRFMIYEAYESQEAADLHKTSLHYIRWRDTVKEYMADTRHGVRYNILEPSDRSQW